MIPVIIIVCIVVAVLMLASALRIVPEYQRLVVFTLGRLRDVRGPGLTVLLPFLDLGIPVDLREQEKTLYDVEVTLADTMVSMEIEVEYRVVDPARVVAETTNIDRVIETMVRSTARTALVQFPADTENWQLSKALHEALEEFQAEYGIKVHEVEIDHMESLKRKRKEKRKNEEI